MAGDERPVTAEDVTEVVRRYAAQRQLPLKHAAVLLEYRGGYPTETLLVEPDATPRTACPSASG